jgi:L,D-peptidoglycan transpeptidase YkuD (ErfK/YbiS/YcfS/YnhG family)
MRTGGLQRGKTIVQIKLFGERVTQITVIIHQQDRFLRCHRRDFLVQTDFMLNRNLTMRHAETRADLSQDREARVIGIFVASGAGLLTPDGAVFTCALGQGGVVAAALKHEGDGASPAGQWPMRRVFYRADRVGAPETALPCAALRPMDGWCDAPGDINYNRPVVLPYAASHEIMWRDDHVYDLVVELGYNDDPVIDGKGSAIFMHIARGDYAPTQGCVALAEADLRAVLRRAAPGDRVDIKA